MFKLKEGQTMGQLTNLDQSPYIHNFVKQKEFIEYKPKKSSTSVINFKK